MNTVIKVVESLTNDIADVAISHDGNLSQVQALTSQMRKFQYSVTPSTQIPLPLLMIMFFEGYLKIDLKTAFSQDKFDGKFVLSISNKLVRFPIQTSIIMITINI